MAQRTTLQDFLEYMDICKQTSAVYATLDVVIGWAVWMVDAAELYSCGVLAVATTDVVQAKSVPPPPNETQGLLFGSVAMDPKQAVF